MANTIKPKSQTTAEEKAALQDTNKALMTGAMSNDDLLDAAEMVESSVFEDAGAEYLELKEGEEKTLILEGFGTMEGQSGTIETANFIGKGNQKFIHGAAMVVSQCKRISENSGIPCIVRLIHNGEKKSNGGQKYSNISVRYLKPVAQG